MAPAARPVETDVVVVGAGLAGLTAARRLTAGGLDVRVLEARDRVGGRTYTVDGGRGIRHDLGGQWIGPTQDHVAAMLTELGLRTFPTWTAGDAMAGMGAQLSRYRGRVPRLGIRVLVDALQAQLRLDRLARRVPPDRPWDAARSLEWDGETFETWIRRATFTDGGGDYFRVVSDAVFASEASSFSLLHALAYIRSGQGVDRLIDTRGGAQQDRVVGGTQQISVLMAEALGDRVVLDAPVHRVEHGDTAGAAGGVLVTTHAATVRAQRAVIAVPPTLAGRIDYRPVLPAMRDQLTQRMPAGAVIKCLAVYDRPFWRDDGLNGQVATNRPPVKITFDNSPPTGGPGVLLAFVEGRAAIELGTVTDDELRTTVLDALAGYFGERARRVEDFVAQDWQKEPWTRGCYGAHLPPGAWTQFGPALRAPIGPIHWAGTETAVVWSGYMDGAIESGERAAREVQLALRG
jgi:monoamine oxidase